MTESSFAYRQERAQQGADCADVAELAAYLHRIAMDAHSLRAGLAQAVSQVFAGTAPPDPDEDSPYPADHVERLLFHDLMGAEALVHDQTLATALRQTMRLLEDAAHATHLARAHLEKP
ncbi:hypothetical protein SROCM77S_00593 [Streptomyces rochei]|uniref:hypothetical protein n=1 Tax=Streptomyces TaxID=1883 RepID=UPI0004CC1C37|nr:hypothetical protein [Streptomyces sp. NRRL WC-3795]